MASLPASFEFQMLYGIRRRLQRTLIQQGWRVRLYVPYGPEWYAYFMRRLAERPANLFFVDAQPFQGMRGSAELQVMSDQQASVFGLC